MGKEETSGNLNPCMRLCGSVSLAILRMLCHGAKRHGGVQIRGRITKKRRKHDVLPSFFGDPSGNRTRVSSVRG